ncbi:MAG: hypothetical protein ACOYM3_02535 [Terrimicrobiaceae bacterium]
MIVALLSSLPKCLQRTGQVPRITLGALALLAALSPSSLRGDDAYTRNPARGLAIYKPNSFQKDASAQITEYRSHQSLDSVTYVITIDGKRLTIPAKTADVVILPYPGRAEAQPEEALAVISLAEYRFPQFQSLLIPLKAAWMEESKRPRKEIEGEIQNRRQNQSIAGRVGAFWNSLIKPNPKPLATPSPRPTLTPATSTDPGLKPSTDLNKNLKTISDYYKSIDAVSGTNEP